MTTRKAAKKKSAKKKAPKKKATKKKAPKRKTVRRRRRAVDMESQRRWLWERTVEYLCTHQTAKKAIVGADEILAAHHERFG